MADKKTKKLTTLIIIGIGVSYIWQMSPSSLLSIIGQDFAIKSDALLNLSMSAIYPTLILGCITGSRLELRLGIHKLFTLILIILFISISVMFLCNSYTYFLICRLLFGLGFGWGVHFMGSCIMKWFSPEQREYMTTLNSLMPFAGTLICFSILPFISNCLGSWKNALAIWGVIIIPALAVWLKTDYNELPNYDNGRNVPHIERHIFSSLLKRKEIFLLCVIFMCDFFCYSYIASVLPTILLETGMGTLTLSSSSAIAAIAFPGVGIIGCIASGLIAKRERKRKPVLIVGQFLKLFGLMVGTLCGNSITIRLAGFSIYGFGNSIWMPSMYNIPLDLKYMDSVMIGASYALINLFGFVSGCISPAIGGLITDIIVRAGATHLRGLLTSLFAFNLFNFIALVCAIIIPETGGDEYSQEA